MWVITKLLQITTVNTLVFTVRVIMESANENAAYESRDPVNEEVNHTPVANMGSMAMMARARNVKVEFTLLIVLSATTLCKGKFNFY